MKKSIYLIVNVLTRIFSDSPQNTLSDAAKFVRGLRCPENRLLNVPGYVCAAISRTPCPQPNILVRNAGYRGMKFLSGLGAERDLGSFIILFRRMSLMRLVI